MFILSRTSKFLESLAEIDSSKATRKKVILNLIVGVNSTSGCSTKREVVEQQQNEEEAWEEQ
jgi:hypothetical protein